MKLCPFCNKEITKKRNKFCNQSCANSYNNKLKPKRQLTYNNCKRCDASLNRKDHNDRRTFCNNCNPKIVDWSMITYGEMKKQRTYQVNSRIRQLARDKYKKSGLPMKCLSCGYSKHVEICHIIGISEHDDDTPVSEINDIKNLVTLCRNHHWELDNGLSSLFELLKFNI